MLTLINLMAAQEVRMVFVTSNIDKDQRLEASRLVDTERGLLGPVAGFGLNVSMGWSVSSGCLWRGPSAIVYGQWSQLINLSGQRWIIDLDG